MCGVAVAARRPFFERRSRRRIDFGAVPAAAAAAAADVARCTFAKVLVLLVLLVVNRVAPLFASCHPRRFACRAIAVARA